MWDAFSVRIVYTAGMQATLHINLQDSLICKIYLMLIVLFFTANYKTARMKLPQAETNTDVQTAEEENKDIQKKKRIRL